MYWRDDDVYAGKHAVCCLHACVFSLLHLQMSQILGSPVKNTMVILRQKIDGQLLYKKEGEEAKETSLGAIQRIPRFRTLRYTSKFTFSLPRQVTPASPSTRATFATVPPYHYTATQLTAVLKVHRMVHNGMHTLRDAAVAVTLSPYYFAVKTGAVSCKGVVAAAPRAQGRASPRPEPHLVKELVKAARIC